MKRRSVKRTTTRSELQQIWDAGAILLVGSTIGIESSGMFPDACNGSECLASRNKDTVVSPPLASLQQRLVDLEHGSGRVIAGCRRIKKIRLR